MKWIAVAFVLSLAPSIPVTAAAGPPTAVRAKAPRGKLPARVRRDIASGKLQVQRTFPEGVIVTEQTASAQYRRFEPFLRAARPPVVYRATGTKPRIDTSSQESTAASIKQLVKAYDAKVQTAYTMVPIKQALRAAGPNARAIILSVSFGGGRMIQIAPNIQKEANIYDLFTARRLGNGRIEIVEAGSGAPAMRLGEFHITRSFGAPGTGPNPPSTGVLWTRTKRSGRRTHLIRNQPEEYRWFVVAD